VIDPPVLLFPALAKIARAARAGVAVPLPRGSTLRVSWSQEARKAVEQWLCDGNLAQLGEALQRHPFLIGHPAVFKQLKHLHWLSRTLDAGAYKEVDATAPDDVPPAGTRLAAREALRLLLERLAQGLLVSGWRLVPPGRRPGRRPVMSTRESVRLLSEYEDLLSLLRREVVRPTGRGRWSPKTAPAWEQELSSVIRRVWEAADTSMDCSTEIVPGAPAGVHSLPPVEQLEYMRTVFSVRPLPTQKIRVLAHEAVELAAAGPIRDHIARALLGHSWGLTVGQVRGRIAAARRDHGALTRARPSRRN
jgi:hypothetical protein